jgi:diguanylate cyclase (GGDEF)-like protein
VLAVFLVVSIGLTNLCLGYALAALLGLAPDSLADAWNVLFGATPPTPSPVMENPAPQAFAPPSPPAEPVRARPEPTPRVTAAVEPAPVPQPEPAPAPEPVKEPIVEPPLQPVAEAEAVPSAEPASSPGLTKHVEDTVLDLNAAIEQSEAKMSEIDMMLRECYGQYQPETLVNGVQGLVNSCQEYLQEQSSLVAQFDKQSGELSDLESLTDQIEMANLELSAKIETTIGRFQALDCAADPAAAGEQLLLEIDKTLNAWHKIREDREEAYLAIARHSGRLEEIAVEHCSDPLTSLPNRVGLELALDQWWAEGRHKRQPTHGIVIDLDRFTAVNRKQGGAVGNRILLHMAKYIRDAVSEESLVGRVAGQQFFVLLAGPDASAAARLAEVMRQSIGRMKFSHNLDKVQVTATCVVGEPTANETPAAFLDRMRRGVKQAQRTQSNRVYRDEGGALPAVPIAEVAAEEREVLI